MLQDCEFPECYLKRLYSLQDVGDPGGAFVKQLTSMKRVEQVDVRRPPAIASVTNVRSSSSPWRCIPSKIPRSIKYLKKFLSYFLLTAWIACHECCGGRITTALV